MLWAAACTCFFGFLRCREAVISSETSYDPQVNLSLEDVHINSRIQPSLVEVNIKVSKTDPFLSPGSKSLPRCDIDGDMPGESTI